MTTENNTLPEWYAGLSPSNPGLSTPMMQQYIEVKKKVPDAVLLFRMGDFYELFLQDALIVGKVLDLTVTSRNKNTEEPVPMAGIPFHALEGYLPRLVQAGYKVAIAEQQGDPSAGKMLERSLTRIVTAGVPWESDADAVSSKESCWLACVTGKGPYGIASMDVSTGEFQVTELPTVQQAIAEIQRLQAKELLLPANIIQPADRDEWDVILRKISHTFEQKNLFDPITAKQILCQQFQVASLSGFGLDKYTVGVSAAGGLLSYVRDITLHDIAHVKMIHKYVIASQMVLDESTKTNLEILHPIRANNRKSTLIHLLDRTKTGMGGRLLRKWLSSPLTDVQRIKRRQDAIEVLLDDQLRQEIQGYLQQIQDLERLSAKVAQNTITPRYLLALAKSIHVIPLIFARLEQFPIFHHFVGKEIPLEIANKIISQLIPEPPMSITDGEIFVSGINPRLDELRSLTTEVQQAIATLEEQQKQTTGISSLKVRYNRVFGYFLEVTAANKEKVPDNWIRKQTLANAERFITPELKEFEDKILTAGDKVKAIEQEMFVELRTQTNQFVEQLQALANRLSYIDVFCCLADIAVSNRYCKPEIDTSMDIILEGSRHPIIENLQMDEDFIPNDICMTEDKRQILLTGPNMSGKSTIMRQVALAVLMAQIGSFVPANRAKIGVCDTIFVRVGASDDLAQGRSTFMVEMAETALILHQSTERSLLMLDEIGRGTSTYDGMSIAWAVCEAVHDKIQARCIFATHYHELTELSTNCSRLRNMHVAIHEEAGAVKFLRILKEGEIGRSYGIQCAKLAGLPKSVIRRATQILANLEKNAKQSSPQAQQLNLFETLVEREVEKEVEVVPEYLEKLEQNLAEININECTPFMALQHLYALQQIVQNKK